MQRRRQKYGVLIFWHRSESTSINFVTAIPISPEQIMLSQSNPLTWQIVSSPREYFTLKEQGCIHANYICPLGTKDQKMKYLPYKLILPGSHLRPANYPWLQGCWLVFQWILPSSFLDASEKNWKNKVKSKSCQNQINLLSLFSKEKAKRAHLRRCHVSSEA